MISANVIMLQALLDKWFRRIYPAPSNIYLFASKLKFGGIEMIACDITTRTVSAQFWKNLPSFRSLELVTDLEVIKALDARKAKYFLDKSNQPNENQSD